MKKLIFVLLLAGIFPAIAQSIEDPVKEPPKLPKIVHKVEIPNAPMIKAAIYTPDSSVRWAAADLATIPEEEREYIRYLSLYNLPREKRPEVAKIVSFMVNSLGARRRMYIPLFVGGSDQTVIRLNIDDYEWTAKAWDDLGRKGSGPQSLIVDSPDPFFHAFIEKLIPQTKTEKKEKQVLATNSFGQQVYKTETYDETIKLPDRKKRILAGAPWVDTTSLSFLIKWTQAESPILRADWFLVNVSLPPAYYNFLKVGNDIKDFEKLIFTDIKLAEKARGQDKAVVISSIVSRNNRTLTRSFTATNGYYWVSHDTKTSVDDRQYILNFLDEKFDATEDIGSLPNGLQAYFLTNGEGKRVDAGDIDIVVDNTAIDRVVRCGRSCIICHAEGLRPIDDEVRTLTKRLQNAEQVRLLITDRDKRRKVEDLFGSDLDRQLFKDNAIYSEAVAQTNGLRTEVNAKFFGEIYNIYAETLLTKETVARDLGIPVADLEKYVRVSSDPVVLGLVKVPIRPMRRDQWERSFQSLMLIVLADRAGVIPVAGVLPAPVPVFVKEKEVILPK